jgi:hypothetical protein
MATWVKNTNVSSQIRMVKGRDGQQTCTIGPALVHRICAHHPRVERRRWTSHTSMIGTRTDGRYQGL